MEMSYIIKALSKTCYSVELSKKQEGLFVMTMASNLVCGHMLISLRSPQKAKKWGG